MAVMPLPITLSETTLTHLNELVEDENSRATEPVEPSRWALRRVLDELKASAPMLNRLDETGTLEIGGGKTLKLADLKSFLLTPPVSGNLTLRVGEYTQRRIERAAAFIEAATRAQGNPVPWKTCAEWVERIVQESVARSYGGLMSRIFEQEEKAAYAPTKEAKPKSHAKP